MHNTKYYKYTYYLILTTFIVRCILSIAFRLGNDESYYFTYATQPDWNHFDHPPLVGLFIRLCTVNLKIINDFTMRLTSILSAAIGTYLIFRIGCLLKNSRTGFIAAILYTTSIYTSIIAGLFILPDSPQMIFWLAALYTAVKIILKQSTQKENSLYLLFGLYAGLATLCKIHGVFLFLGLGLYALLYDRSILKKKQLYISIFLYLILISPIVFWNIANNFITFRYQGERVIIHHAFINFNSFFTTFMGQLFYNNPVNVIIYILFAGRAAKTLPYSRTKQLLLSFSLPIIIATTVISLFRTTLPHWSGPGFIPLMLLAAVAMDSSLQKPNSVVNRWLYTAGTVIVVTTFFCITLINQYPGTFGEKQPPNLGKLDFSLDMYGWKDLADQFGQIHQLDLQNGSMHTSDPIVVDKWFPACHYYLYLAFPMKMRMVGIGNIDDLHKFVWLNKMEGQLRKGQNAYFIVSSEYYKDPKTLYGQDFQKIILTNKIWQKRGGKTARYWEIYHLVDAKRDLGTMLP